MNPPLPPLTLTQQHARQPLFPAPAPPVPPVVVPSHVPPAGIEQRPAHPFPSSSTPGSVAATDGRLTVPTNQIPTAQAQPPQQRISPTILAQAAVLQQLISTEVEKCRQSYNSTIDGLLQKAHQHADALRELNRLSERVVVERDEAREELVKVREENEVFVSAVKEEHASEVERVKEGYEAAMRRMREERRGAEGEVAGENVRLKGELETVKAELDRMRDVVGQLESLKKEREAAQAEKSSLRSELATTQSELRSLSEDHTRLKEALESDRSDLIQTRTQLAHSESSLQRAESDLEAANSSIYRLTAESRTEREALQARLEAADSERKGMQARKNAAEVKNARLANVVIGLRKNEANLKEELGAAQQALKQRDEDVKAGEERLVKVKDEIEELQNEKRGLVELVKEGVEQQARVADERDGLRREKERLEVGLVESVERLEVLGRERDGVVEEKRMLEGVLSATQSVLGDVNAEKDALTREKGELEGMARQLGGRVEELRGELERSVKAGEEDRARHKAGIGALEGRLRDAQTELESARATVVRTEHDVESLKLSLSLATETEISLRSTVEAQSVELEKARTKMQRSALKMEGLRKELDDERTVRAGVEVVLERRTKELGRVKMGVSSSKATGKTKRVVPGTASPTPGKGSKLSGSKSKSSSPQPAAATSAPEKEKEKHSTPSGSTSALTSKPEPPTPAPIPVPISALSLAFPGRDADTPLLPSALPLSSTATVPQTRDPRLKRSSPAPNIGGSSRSSGPSSAPSTPQVRPTESGFWRKKLDQLEQTPQTIPAEAPTLPPPSSTSLSFSTSTKPAAQGQSRDPRSKASVSPVASSSKEPSTPRARPTEPGFWQNKLGELARGEAATTSSPGGKQSKPSTSTSASEQKSASTSLSLSTSTKPEPAPAPQSQSRDPRLKSSASASPSGSSKIGASTSTPAAQFLQKKLDELERGDMEEVGLGESISFKPLETEKEKKKGRRVELEFRPSCGSVLVPGLVEGEEHNQLGDGDRGSGADPILNDEEEEEEFAELFGSMDVAEGYADDVLATSSDNKRKAMGEDSEREREKKRSRRSLSPPSPSPSSQQHNVTATTPLRPLPPLPPTTHTPPTPTRKPKPRTTGLFIPKKQKSAGSPSSGGRPVSFESSKWRAPPRVVPTSTSAGAGARVQG